MLKQKEAVIFDLDGTLVDSMWMWKRIDIEFLESRNITYPDKLQEEIEGMSFSETIRHFKQKFAFNETQAELEQLLNNMALPTAKARHILKFLLSIQQITTLK